MKKRIKKICLTIFAFATVIIVLIPIILTITNSFMAAS